MTAATDTRQCRYCRVTKPVVEFIWSRGKPTWKCRACNKALCKKYHESIGKPRRRGATPETYEALLIFQDGRCAICREEPTVANPLCIDHDHETGRIRGLLCNDCNLAIGRFHDNIERMKAAIKYLGGGES